ncbi:MAG: hypothetical protein WD738_22485 [Pirellulales bacterium]
MGLVNRLLNRPLSQDKFAKSLLKRIRASGDTSFIRYDPANFRFLRSDERMVFLSNTYQEYLRLEVSERETLIQRFLATWHTTSLPVPEEFDDVRADNLPALRVRSFFEIDVHRAAGDNKVPSVPHELIAEHLALSLVYDLPTSMMTGQRGAAENVGRLVLRGDGGRQAESGGEDDAVCADWPGVFRNARRLV